MKIYRGIPTQKFNKTTVIGIGVFDGVHLGHQKLIQTVMELSARHKASPTIITFHPHPSHLFSPQKKVPLIEPIESRLKALKSMGIERCVVVSLDAKFASITSEVFSKTILKTVMNAGHVVVGSTFRYGKNTKGDIHSLIRQGEDYGFKVRSVSERTKMGAVVSSTRIRHLIMQGDFNSVCKLNGNRPYMYVASKIQGRGRGARMGYPTLNLSATDQVVPNTGVYAGWIIDENNGLLDAAIHVGPRLTFDDTESIEVHALSKIFFTAPPKKPLKLIFFKFIRKTKKFPSQDLLINAIKEDVLTIKNILISRPALHFKSHSVY